MCHTLNAFRSLSIAAFCIFALPPCAAETLDKVLVDETGKSRGAVKEQTIVALRSQTGGGTLEIRCIPRDGLSARVLFAVSARHYGADIRMKYRADTGSVSDDKVWPSGKVGVILPNARQILDDAAKASTLHIELNAADGYSATMVFRLQEAPKALSQIRSDCPDDAQPPDTNGQAK